MEISFLSSSSFSFSDIKNKIQDLKLVLKENTDLGLYIIKYIKDCSFMDNEDVRKCRGVVVSKENNKILCVPPTKSFELDKFTDTINSQQHWNNVTVEEFIDGTMINYFYYKEQWVLSTRSKIGAQCNWYSEKTFNEMFKEATENLDLNKLNKEYFYTFVLQHPENRIVTKYTKADIVLVSVGKVNEDNSFEYLDIHDKSIVDCDITLPTVYSFNDINEVKDKVNTLDYMNQGFVLKTKVNGVSMRSKIRNEKYNYVKELRGNKNNLKDVFYELYQNDYHTTYLKYFPEEQNLFIDFENEFLSLVKNVFYSYKAYHIEKKVTDINHIPYKHRPLCYELHGQYKQYRSPITYNTVYTYLKQLPVRRITFTLEPLN